MSLNDGTEYPYVSPHDPEPSVLYTFCELKWLKSTVAGNLKFAPPRTYNDIHENTIFARPLGNTQSTFLAEEKINAWLDSHVVRCFTKDPTNTLMWAHYADKHKGVCVGFSFEKLKNRIFDDRSLRHIPVRYSSTPPLTLISEPMDEHAVSMHALDILMTKSIHWAYEQEYRFYIQSPEPVGDEAFILNVGGEAVVDVIFGEQVEATVIEEQVRAFPNNLNPRIATIDRRSRSYNLAFRDVFVRAKL